MSYNLFRDWSFGRTIAAAVMVVCAGVATSQAATVDLGALEIDKTYSYNQGDEVSAQFTSEEGGVVKLLFTGITIAAYQDPAHQQLIEMDFVGYTGHNGEVAYTISMAAGQTVYFYDKWVIGDGSIKVASKPKGLNLTGITPSPTQGESDYYGGKLSIAQDYRLTFMFDQTVKVTSASVRLADKSYKSTSLKTYGNSVEVSIFTPVMEFYREGKLKDGDEITIRLVGLACEDAPDVMYDGRGTLNVNYVVADKPAELVATYNTPATGMPAMKSYYLPGDENAVLTLEFDRELDPARRPVASLSFGNPESMEYTYYTETIQGKVDGKKLMIDFSGKRRRPADMIPGNFTFEKGEDNITVGVSNMYTPDGQRIFTGSQTTYASFYYSYPIEVVQYTMASDFTPARGKAIKPGTPVEIWVMNGSMIAFDAVRLSYKKDGADKTLDIEKDKLTVAPDPDSASDLLINFTMPEDFTADEGSTINVSLKGLNCADGLDHSTDIKGNYVFGTSGVDSVSADVNVQGDVYNVMGIRVLKGATLREVLALPSGLYIFNGRKIAVK